RDVAMRLEAIEARADRGEVVPRTVEERAVAQDGDHRRSARGVGLGARRGVELRRERAGAGAPLLDLGDEVERLARLTGAGGSGARGWPARRRRSASASSGGGPPAIAARSIGCTPKSSAFTVRSRTSPPSTSLTDVGAPQGLTSSRPSALRTTHARFTPSWRR